jgi:putative SOS response-associated peptidase YedK
MCGRFVSSQTPDQISAYFGASFEGLGTSPAPDATAADLPANFNVAPTNDVYGIVGDGNGHRELQIFHWGLVPSWAKDVKIGSKMINARAETLAEKPAFKSAFRKHRMILPMDGFYEWRQGSATEAPQLLTKAGKPVKQPMFIHRADGEPLAVAALWTTWRDRDAGPDAPWLHSCTIITTSANATMTPVHDRMPVILPQAVWDEWLDPRNADLESLQRLLVPAADDLLAMHPVSTDVNNVRNKGAELIEPINPASPT